MPFLIAGFVYGFFAALTLAVVGSVYLVKRRPPMRAILVGVIGSLVGFLIGCVVAALVCIVVPGVGAFTGATAVVVLASLSFALLGTTAGVTATRRTRQSVA